MWDEIKEDINTIIVGVVLAVYFNVKLIQWILSW